MSITIKKYIDIISGVIGAAVATRRELILRYFTENVNIPVNGFADFTTLDEVGDFFGTDSDEFKRATEYFNFTSISLNSADKITFAGYATSAIESRIIGNQQAQVLADLNAVTTGELTIDIGGIGGTTAAIDLSSAVSIAAAMTLIQTALRATNVGPAIASLTVTYDAVLQRVNLVAGATGENPITISSTTVGFLDLLGWSNGAVFSDGSDGDSITAILNDSASASDNFGSFAFVETLSDAQILEAATWTHGENVKYMYLVPTLAADAQDFFDELGALSGVALTLVTGADGDYAESIPGILLATTDYDGNNSVINYMYKVVNYPVSVDDTSTSDSFDDIRTNYQGQTQQAGQALFFYQRGLLLGPVTAPLDMNTFSNEIWFKDAIIVGLLQLLLAVEEIPANRSGVLMINGNIKDRIDEALRNGVISVGKTLNPDQKSAVKSFTGSNEAASQIENAGFWLEVTIIDNAGEKEGQYKLAYSKDDVVRKITGTQALV